MKLMKKIATIVLALAMVVVFAACGSGNGGSQGSGASDGGSQGGSGKKTVLWLSNLSSGINYEAPKNYMAAICQKLGYDFKVCTGDMFNGAAENLTIVKDNMTDDVVAIIASQDGGLLDIMEEFPDVYVCGYNASFDSVYSDDPAVAVNAAALENDHFLGCICDGYYDGNDIGAEYAEACIRLGYKNVALVTFPSFAYPALEVSCQKFREVITEYNATAADADKITIYGEDPATVLMFSPLEESWFIDNKGCDNLDCIIAACSGVQFVFPTMVTAKANGTCAQQTHMISGGFDDNADIVANIGTDKTITHITFSPAENPMYPMILLDDALNGALPADFAPVRIVSAPYTIETDEDIDAVMNKSMTGTADVSLAQVSVDEVVSMCASQGSTITHAELIDFMHSDQLSVAWLLKNR